MKITLIGSSIFLFIFSVSAGTFMETFDGGDLAEWQELVQLNNASGSWEIINNELHAVSRETFVRLLTTGDDTWEDYTVEFDVKPLKKHGIGSISIAARVTGTSLVLCSIADPVVLIDGETVHVERMSCYYGDLHGVVFVILHTEPHSLLRLNKWSHLKLDIQGKWVTFWVNGKQVMESSAIVNFKDVQDQELNKFPDLLTGGVGLGLANYTARFDNITVTGNGIPNRGGLAVNPKGKLATMWGNLKRF